MRRLPSHAAACVLLLLLFSPAGSDAQAPNRTGPAAKQEVDEEILSRLVRQLGDSNFAVREMASQRLRDLGRRALPALKRAAASDNLEVSRRAGSLVQAICKTIFGQVGQLKGHAGEGYFLWATRLLPMTDGKRLMTCGGDTLLVWRLADGKIVRSIDAGVRGRWALGLSRDGTRAIVGDTDGGALVFDAANYRIITRLKGHRGQIWGAVLTADGKRAVTGSWDKSLRLWDAVTGKELISYKCEGMVRAVALAPDERHFVSAHFNNHGEPGVLRLYDIEQPEPVRTFTGHQLEVSGVAFSPDGKRLLSCSFDKTARLWDVETGKELRRFEGHTARVESVAFWPDGRHAISAGDQDDRLLRIWNVETGELVMFSEELAVGFTCVVPLPDGRRCATASKDGVVRIWEWKDGTLAAAKTP
jgi:WD40 repeat protein